MATRKWRGDAPAVRQVDTLTPGGTIEIGDKFLVTINGKSVTYSATGTTVASVCTGLAAALTASTIPEFLEITWADATTAVTATAVTAGTPFTLTVSTTESDGSAADAQTFSRAATTANSSPHDWSLAANWSGATVPVNGDDVIVTNTTSSILYGLDQSAVSLASLTVDASFTGKIGLPEQNTDNDDPYYEYRGTYLQVGATTVTIGQGSGPGSSRIMLDSGSVACALRVRRADTPESTSRPAILWKGTSANNTVDITQGTLGVAMLAGESATLKVLRIGYQTQPLYDVTVYLGAGATVTTLTKTGGNLYCCGSVAGMTFVDGGGLLLGP